MEEAPRYTLVLVPPTPEVGSEVPVGVPEAIIPETAATSPLPEATTAVLPVPVDVDPTGSGGPVVAAEAYESPARQGLVRKLGYVARRAVDRLQLEVGRRPGVSHVVGGVAVAAALYATRGDVGAAHAMTHGFVPGAGGGGPSAEPVHATLLADTSKASEAVTNAVREPAHTPPDAAAGAEGYRISPVWSDVSAIAGRAVPWAIYSALPVGAVLQGRGHVLKQREHHEPEEIHQHAVEAIGLMRQAVVNEGKAGDTLIELARSPRVNELDMMNIYMKYIAGNFNNIHTPRQMAKYLQHLQIGVHKSEIVVHNGEFMYFGRGSDGYASSGLQQYMNGTGITDADTMATHLRGDLGLSVSPREISYDRRAGTFTYAYGGRLTQANAKSNIISTAPEKTGTNAAIRASVAAAQARGSIDRLPLSKNFLGRPETMKAMSALERKGPNRNPGSPKYGMSRGLLTTHTLLERNLEAVPGTNVAAIAHVANLLRLNEAAIANHVDTIIEVLKPAELQALGIDPPEKIKGARIGYVRRTPAQNLILARQLRSLVVR